VSNEGFKIGIYWCPQHGEPAFQYRSDCEYDPTPEHDEQIVELEIMVPTEPKPKQWGVFFDVE
jgi:hypothetical protein